MNRKGDTYRIQESIDCIKSYTKTLISIRDLLITNKPWVDYTLSELQIVSHLPNVLMNAEAFLNEFTSEHVAVKAAKYDFISVVRDLEDLSSLYRKQLKELPTQPIEILYCHLNYHSKQLTNEKV